MDLISIFGCYDVSEKKFHNFALSLKVVKNTSTEFFRVQFLRFIIQAEKTFVTKPNVVTVIPSKILLHLKMNMKYIKK